MLRLRCQVQPSLHALYVFTASRAHALLRLVHDCSVTVLQAFIIAVCNWRSLLLETSSPAKSVRPIGVGQLYTRPPPVTARVPSLDQDFDRCAKCCYIAYALVSGCEHHDYRSVRGGGSCSDATLWLRDAVCDLWNGVPVTSCRLC